MFGTIVTNSKALSKEDRERYGQWYCGLCTRLDAHFGSAGIATLTFDMTFVTILLSSLYQLREQHGSQRCAPHPVRGCSFVTTPATDYAAFINVILAYYQCLDDWNDDRNLAAREKSRQLEKFLPAIKERYPRQSAVIRECLAELSAMEKANELNPDLPANCFGHLMGEMFVWAEDEYSATLRKMGSALGRYVYLLDAVNDLRADIKKQRYNPLVAQMDTDFTPVLTMMMAECTEAFDKLPLQQDLSILQNVLYSGVWQNYRIKKRKGTEE